MAKQYRSDALAAIHETLEALHEAGAIDNQTMRDFNETCLTPVKALSPEEIRALREREHLSQPVFCLLYTSPSPRDRTRSRMPSSA